MSETPVEEAPVEEAPEGETSYHLHEEKDWAVEVTVVSRKYNETTPQANIFTENKVVTRDVVTDSRLLEILNFVQPKN